jgi:hypothetical protein
VPKAGLEPAAGSVRFASLPSLFQVRAWVAWVGMGGWGCGLGRRLGAVGPLGDRSDHRSSDPGPPVGGTV